MGKFRESRTAISLHTAFAAEAQARTRYDFFADKARDEGYIQISRLFRETAQQEYEHALRFFKFFNGGELPINWTFPSGVIESTHANLLSSAALEQYVGNEMYPLFAQIADEEGFARAADTLRAITVSEQHHEALFRHLAQNLATGRAFQAETQIRWRCLSCGYIHTGDAAPEKCPACVRPTGYFERLCENY
jgi:rubrerythrin